ncbi:unnamed protein product [Ranitomeya imitator]|uniref:Cysteine dioxygenase n=1 Tax=Ranitomeya imitator TaxID=111125 RepID=A0ABN9KSI9_9NEOB|nr:unnamed protein product [Ranitomeya imitator]
MAFSKDKPVLSCDLKSLSHLIVPFPLCSSIHDHTNSHCFLKLLQGNLKETLYDWPQKKSNGSMVKKSEGVLKLNQCAYINDSIGLHRVENSSHTETAVSLHLYSPPFDHCQTFDQRTGHKNTVKMTFWSKFGERTPVVSVQIFQIMV